MRGRNNPTPSLSKSVALNNNTDKMPTNVAGFLPLLLLFSIDDDDDDDDDDRFYLALFCALEQTHCARV